MSSLFCPLKEEWMTFLRSPDAHWRHWLDGLRRVPSLCEIWCNRLWHDDPRSPDILRKSIFLRRARHRRLRIVAHDLKHLTGSHRLTPRFGCRISLRPTANLIRRRPD